MEVLKWADRSLCKYPSLPQHGTLYTFVKAEDPSKDRQTDGPTCLLLEAAAAAVAKRIAIVLEKSDALIASSRRCRNSAPQSAVCGKGTDPLSEQREP